MKKVLDVTLAIMNGDRVERVTAPVKMTCVFGPPTADPGGPEIPLRVKDILMNDKPLDFNQRQLVIEWLGGESELSSLIERFN